MALARALDSVNSAFADRIFTRQAVARSGARDDWRTYASKLHSDKSPNLDERTKTIDSINGKLVKTSQVDLKLPVV